MQLESVTNQPEADPSTRHPATSVEAPDHVARDRQHRTVRGAKVKQLGGVMVEKVKKVTSTPAERESLMGANGLELQRQREGAAVAAAPAAGGDGRRHGEAEPEPEPEQVEVLPANVALPSTLSSEDGDTQFRDGMFSAYLNRVEEKGCAWRQELDRCGIVLDFEPSPRKSATIEAAQQKLAEAAEAPRLLPQSLGAAPPSPAPAPLAAGASRGKVMVRSDRTAPWVEGEIVALDEETKMATVQFSGGVCRVLLSDPSRVRLMPTSARR